ncbi:MAG: leucine-rich repeat domain-containing protein [Coriobacteriia bacterium]|nr:leucine-rich repeat domain-containing protein [Coriobacteriia bacterium]
MNYTELIAVWLIRAPLEMIELNNTSRFVRLTAQQYHTLIEFNKAHANEMAALMLGKKDGRDVDIYSVQCNPLFTKESTEGSLTYNLEAVEQELAAANKRDGADAAVLMHTHPPGNLPQLSFRDKISYRVWVLDEKRFNLEIFKGVILAPHITFWDLEGLFIEKMELLVDGYHIETPAPVSALAHAFSGAREGWSGLPANAVVLNRKDAKLITGTHITIPSGYTHIYENAFEGRKDIVSVAIPSGVIKIGNWAFASCRDLRTVTIPEGITEIPAYMFFLSKSLETIFLPRGVTAIGHESFYNCENLTSVVMPESVTTISKKPFKGCKKLTVTCQGGSYAHNYCQENQIPVLLY